MNLRGRFLPFFVLASFVLGASGVACSNSSANEPLAPADAGADRADVSPSPPAPYPARHAPLPALVNARGLILAQPVIVPVFYENDPFEAQIMEFLNSLVRARYWKETMAEYGVGAAMLKPAVHLPGPAPASITGDAIGAWVEKNLENGTVLPPFTTHSLYLLYYPSGTTVVDTSGTSCVDFGAYHAATPGGIAYAVLPRCESYLGLSGLDIVTDSTSHEVVEACTDPDPYRLPGYGISDYDGTGWAMVTGGPFGKWWYSEAGDLCEFVPNATVRPPDLGFAVQRTWSNASAAAGHDPCVPAPSGPYFGAALETELTDVGARDRIAGVAIPSGGSRTVELRLFSEAPTEPFTVSVQVGGGRSKSFPDAPDALSFSLDKERGTNGDVLHLTISRHADGTIPFTVTSTLGDRKTTWHGIVGN